MPPADLTCPPRFSTPRNLDRPTRGAKAAEVAAQLGLPLMPWQRYVCDVALEVDPDTGRPAYRNVVLLVPRQSGKTTLILTLAVLRALSFAERQVVVYAAQTRNDARKKWEDDHLATLDASPMGKRKPKPYRTRKTNGNEAIIWRHNGSLHGITASGETSGHGPTVDLAFIDEAFAQRDGRLEQAFKPSQITRTDAQFWVMSTAGRSEELSPYLWAKVVAGRERSLSGEHGRTAYFEWSASEDMDRGDPATWWATMPALGITQTEEAVAADFESMDPAEFDRAYLNRWNPNAVDSVIPMERWLELGVSQGISGSVDLAIDTASDRSWSAIAACGSATGFEDRAAVEIIDNRPGTDWVAARLAELVERQPVRRIMVASSGPAAALLPTLEGMRLPISEVGDRDFTRACGSLLDDVTAGLLVHRPHPVVQVSVAAAERSISGEGWKLSRRRSSVDICPLVAITLARWGHLQGASADPEPDFIVI